MKAMRDSSIDARTKDGGMASEAYQTEIVTPVCGYEDIADIQEILRQRGTTERSPTKAAASTSMSMQANRQRRV